MLLSRASTSVRASRPQAARTRAPLAVVARFGGELGSGHLLGHQARVTGRVMLAQQGLQHRVPLAQ